MGFPRSTFTRFALLLGLLLFVSQGVVYLLYHRYVLNPAADRLAQLLASEYSLYRSNERQIHTLPPALRLLPPDAIPGHPPKTAFLRMTAAHLHGLAPGADLRVGPSGKNGETLLWVREGPALAWLGIRTGTLDLAGPQFILIRVLVIELFTLLGVLLIVRQINRPLNRLAERARRIGRGDSPELEDSVGGPIEVLALEQAMRRMAEDLRELYEERSLLLTGISHELRTPLSRLLVALHLSDRHFAAQRPAMQADVEEMNEIIDRFLTLVRSGREEAFIDGDAGALLQQGADLARDRYGLKVDVDGPLPAVRLRYKPMAMERVFRNLLDNAARYGGGRIQLRMESQPPFVEIIVRDFGPGVDTTLLPQLGQHSPPRQHGKGGAGIGLKICQRMLVMQGGELRFANAPGGGLEVRVRIPLSPG